ncbi:MAG: DUF4432 domain-containing protein [Spirochaetae bacterium HGW-Spirochaetae-2]|jgi:hypothetical protein|nr:MAG: DUF4432 domain-containing protein [Spirochaetae bacterium HGW-Spirochaetae-2]
MADYLGKSWTREGLRAYISDESAIAGASPFVFNDGKAAGVQGIDVYTGSGLAFQVIPGRAMDIYGCSYKGIPLQFTSATGMTSPGYYEEPGLNWLRTFFGGLLSTCGITNSGAPSTDNGNAFGLHGRIGNAGAEHVSISQKWIGDEYVISISGRMREAFVMGENLTLTRTISTRLGSNTIRIEDAIENRGFEPQPLMMLYHFNFGFPLLSEKSRIVIPSKATTPRDKQSEVDNGVSECFEYPKPTQGYKEKVFFHSVGAESDGKTFVALVNPDIQGKPLAIMLRYNRNELPQLTEWKMPGKGCYVCGLEPGTVNPIGRAKARETKLLPMLGPQEVYNVAVELEVLDSIDKINGLDVYAKSLRNS